MTAPVANFPPPTTGSSPSPNKATSNKETLFISNRFTYDNAKAVIEHAKTCENDTKFLELVHNSKGCGNSFGKDLALSYSTITQDIYKGIRQDIAVHIRLIASVVILVHELRKIDDVDECAIKNLELLVNKLSIADLSNKDDDLQNISIAAGALLEKHIASISNKLNIHHLTFYHFTLTKDIKTSKVAVELPFASNKTSPKSTYFHHQDTYTTTSTQQLEHRSKYPENTSKSILHPKNPIEIIYHIRYFSSFAIQHPSILFTCGIAYRTNLKFGEVYAELTKQSDEFMSQYSDKDMGGGIEIRFKITTTKESEQTDEIHCLVLERWSKEYGYNSRKLVTAIGGKLGENLKDKNFSDLLVNAAQEKLNLHLCDQNEEVKQIILKYINPEDNDKHLITSTAKYKYPTKSDGYIYITLVKTIEISPEQFKDIYTLLHDKYNLKLMLLQEIREITSNPTSEQRILNSVHVIECANAEKSKKY